MKRFGQKLGREETKVIGDGEDMSLGVKMVDGCRLMTAENESETAVLDPLETKDRRRRIVRKCDWGRVVDDGPDELFVCHQKTLFVLAERRIGKGAEDAETR